MTPNTVLIELLNRINANNGAPIFINDQELNEWPSDFVVAIKSCALIIQASPATNITCLGCEQSCSMPVNILHQENTSQAFVFCDKREDAHRISIPFSYLERWQASGYSIANLIAKLLGLSSSITSTNSYRWELGVLKGKNHASHLVLISDNKFFISVAGHQLNLDELLLFDKKTIKIDNRKIIRLIDNPVHGGGDAESKKERDARIKKRVNELKSKNVKGFLKQTAQEYGISVTRIKQILDDKIAKHEW